MIEAGQALPGRDKEHSVLGVHFVNDSDMRQAATNGLAELFVGMGCFWGVERIFWQVPGVVTTSVGYGGGFTKNASYEEVCTGLTGHTELVRIVFDTNKVKINDLLKIFWERHDPTQGMQQGNDLGTQYRSALYVTDAALLPSLEASKSAYQLALSAADEGVITTEVALLPNYFLAEEYHQQYLAKNPEGYCGVGGTGVSCPI